MSVTNIYVKPDDQPQMRIANQQGFTMNHRKKFQRPSTTKHKHVADVFDEPEEKSEYDAPRGTTSKHQLQTFSRGDR